MKADIFTGGPSTLKGSPKTDAARDCFGGGFRSVANLGDELIEDGVDTQIHVLTEEWGYVTGDDKITDKGKLEEGEEELIDEQENFRGQIRDSASDSDIVVLLFTKENFRTLVSSQWDQLVNEVRSGSIWCISTSEKAIDEVDLDALREEGVDLIQYERVGVARIGTEAKHELRKTIDS